MPQYLLESLTTPAQAVKATLNMWEGPWSVTAALAGAQPASTTPLGSPDSGTALTLNVPVYWHAIKPNIQMQVKAQGKLSNSKTVPAFQIEAFVMPGKIRSAHE